jgi:hypothetical protein
MDDQQQKVWVERRMACSAWLHNEGNVPQRLAAQIPWPSPMQRATREVGRAACSACPPSNPKS